MEIKEVNRAKGKSICAVATILLFCTLGIRVTEGQYSYSPPTVTFTTDPDPPGAYELFNITLTVYIDPSVIFPEVDGWFSVLDPAQSNATVYGPAYWILKTWTSTGVKSWNFTRLSLPSGNYFLWTSVFWVYQATPWNLETTSEDKLIYVAPSPAPVKQYSIEWLKPISLGKPFQTGRMIKIKFSVFDSNGDFVHDESVKVTVTTDSGVVFISNTTAVYGEGASPVRIKDSAECYIVYWKTEKGMSGQYTITVTFTDAQATNAQKTLTIRP